jgi:COMPASS component SWD3
MLLLLHLYALPKMHLLAYQSFARYSPNSQYILAGTLDNTIRMWTVGTIGTPTKCVKTYQGHKNEKYSVFSCFATTHGSHIISGSEDSKVCVVT